MVFLFYTHSSKTKVCILLLYNYNKSLYSKNMQG